MSKPPQQHSPMDRFPAAQQPDEGYSEAPLDPAQHNDDDLSAAAAALRPPSSLLSWLATNASLLPVAMKTELTTALLDELPTSVIAEIVERLHPRLYIDFIRYLPPEICLKVLRYLDPVSLVAATSTCRAWYDLALDRTLWERLYALEGWKAIYGEIDKWEAKVNAGLTSSIGHLHRIQTSSEGHTSKIRALLNDDDDLDMVDSDRAAGAGDSVSGGILGSPESAFSYSRRGVTPMGEMDLDTPSAKGKSVDRSLGPSGTGSKRREPGGDAGGDLGGDVDDLLPPILPSRGTDPPVQSTLWAWDMESSRYRINWKYLYNMRRRLESNWDKAKYTPFQLPHPNHPEEGHKECVYTMQFDRDYLVSGSRDQTMRIWNMKTHRLVMPPLTGHIGSVLCLQFDADPEEDILVSGSSDSKVIIWKFSTGEIVQQITRAHRESVLNVSFDKRILATSSKDRSIKIFNRRPLRYGDLGYGGSDLVDPVPRNVRPYGYEPDLAHELPVKPPFTMIARLDGHGAAVNAIQVHDRTIVSASGDRHIKVWNWPDQVCVQTIPAHAKGIAAVQYDGRRIVTASSDFDVSIFDAPTGLRVAQLRGHSYLVRTVQAGFADLPYSLHEDAVEAAAVDAQYLRAVEAGEIDPTADQHHRNRVGHRPNSGSSRPEDLQAVGARVPPSGGGGRRYGRIVSGSYDQTIIIWRRDKEGVWKPAHTLRQEEAAAAAQVRATAANAPFARTSGASAGTGASSQSSTHLHPSLLPHGEPSSAAARQADPGVNSLFSLPPGMADFYRPRSRASGSYMAIIDQLVPLGVGSLRQALATTPILLIYHNYLQAAIEREPSPFVRAQMRQVVTNAIITIQNEEAARRHLAAGGPGMPGDAATSPAAPVSTPTSSAVGVAGSTASQGSGSNSDNNGSGGGTSQQQQQQASQSSANGPPPITLPPILESLLDFRNDREREAQQAGHPPGWQNHQPGYAGAAAAAASLFHPHIAPPEITPSRVFKLQFDAHKIVCCSQAPVIVGFDFCNGDPELEEVSRFFATVK